MLLHLWNAWGKPFLLALAVLLLTHFFLFRLVSVSSHSMYGTIYAGDVLLVNRTATWNRCNVGDLVVFRDPAQDELPLGRRRLLVKRVIAAPGDTLQIKKAQVHVNGALLEEAAHVTHDYYVQVLDSARINSLATQFELPAETDAHSSYHRWPLSNAQREAFGKAAHCTPFEREGGRQENVFPFSPFFSWNAHNMGPLVVPAAMQQTQLDAARLPLYDRVITQFEAKQIKIVQGKPVLNEEVLSSYTFKNDYYFVMGDNRDRSIDSRYWGFLPEDHIIGTVSSVVISKDNERRRTRYERFFKNIAKR